MRRSTIALGLVGILAAAGAYAAEKEADVEALINKGLKAYKDGDSADAITALQEAISALQKSQEKGFAAFFPKPPAGWEAGKLDSQSMSAGTGEGAMNYSTLSQSFTQGKGDGQIRVKVTLTNSPQFAETYKGMAETYKNPEMLKILNADPKQKLTMIDQNGWVGFRHIQKESKAEAFAFCGSCLLMVEANKDDEQALDAIWNAIDLKGLAAAVPRTTSRPAK